MVMQNQLVTYRGQPYRVLSLVRLANEPVQVWLAAEGFDAMVCVAWELVTQ